MQSAPSRRAGVNKSAKDDSISRVSRKNPPMLSGSSWVAVVPLGWERFWVSQLRNPAHPGPPGRGSFLILGCRRSKRRPIFKAPLRGASTDGAIETGFPEGDLSFSVRSTRLNIDNELRAKHVNTRSTPASRRDAQKIGRHFSAGYLRYAMGPVPEGRDEQTGQR